MLLLIICVFLVSFKPKCHSNELLSQNARLNDLGAYGTFPCDTCGEYPHAPTHTDTHVYTHIHTQTHNHIHTQRERGRGKQRHREKQNTHKGERGSVREILRKSDESPGHVPLD